ncbi:MAG: hypothetical protein J3Q66DRAFT_292434 [Benniella sp.]|nr:MAG: hypothetical protein J3Q66DRAFT_292434 [Benniella sp.]
MFSNERTFIQWIKFSILLGITALVLCNFGRSESVAFCIGVATLTVAMGTLVYAAVVFHRQGKVNYYDRVGPTILCCVLLFGYSINLYRE